ncbi:MAG: NUDIX domain-containing protein [Bacteroidetes bacterium]|nr:NUDIX domain-containing protein [Bacteroidota bacterium]MCH8524174.1 NUDIX domain-containing protein [Balneolales bacterium]
MSHPFGNKVRVRVNGIVMRDDAVLLVNLQSPTRPEPFWTPPGGGVEFGETMTDALTREIREETGIHTSVERLLYVSEYVKPPWHAVECYFLCKEIGGTLLKGSDPELSDHQQMIRQTAFITLHEMKSVNVIPEFLRHRLPDLLKHGAGSPEWIH